MSGMLKTIAGGAGKAAFGAAKVSAKAAAKAAVYTAKRGAKLAVENAPDFESFSKWLIRIVTNLPKYLRLYFCLMTDNRVSHKAKVVLVVAIAALGAHFAFTGILYHIQVILSLVLGPFAFFPTILIILISLDICYKLISSEILDGYQKELFGEGNSIQSDLQRMREFLGSSYAKIKQKWQTKADKAEKKMAEQGMIAKGQITDEAIQDVSDQIVALETSEKLQSTIEKNVKRLGGSNAAALDTLDEVKRELLAE